MTDGQAGSLPPAVVVHGLQDAVEALTAAREIGCPVTLLSGPGAASYGGAGWFRALVDAAAAEVPGADFVPVLDCAEAAGHAQAALSVGLPAIVFSGGEAAAGRIADIAAGQGTLLLRARPSALDLRRVRRNRAERLRAWLDSVK